MSEATERQYELVYTARFPSGVAGLSEADKQALQKLSPTLEGQRLTLVGYTDSVGPAEVNHRLALRRAQSVKTYLAAHGLDAKAIQVNGRGHCGYLQSNDTPAGRAANRRTEIRRTPVASHAPSAGRPPLNQPEGEKP